MHGCKVCRLSRQRLGSSPGSYWTCHILSVSCCLRSQDDVERYQSHATKADAAVSEVGPFAEVWSATANAMRGRPRCGDPRTWTYRTFQKVFSVSSLKKDAAEASLFCCFRQSSYLVHPSWNIENSTEVCVHSDMIWHVWAAQAKQSFSACSERFCKFQFSMFLCFLIISCDVDSHIAYQIISTYCPASQLHLNCFILLQCFSVLFSLLRSWKRFRDRFAQLLSWVMAEAENHTLPPKLPLGRICRTGPMASPMPDGMSNDINRVSGCFRML